MYFLYLCTQYKLLNICYCIMNKNVLLAFLGGVVAGGFAALLLAPRSGEETREYLTEKLKSGIKSGLGEEQYNDLREKIQDLKSSVTNKLSHKEA